MGAACSNRITVPSENGLGRIFLALAGNRRSKAGGTKLSCVGKSGGCPFAGKNRIIRICITGEKEDDVRVLDGIAIHWADGMLYNNQAWDRGIFYQSPRYHPLCSAMTFVAQE